MDIVEYIKDYTTEEWETIPINIRMRLYATGEYDFYKEDSIEAADEIERLQKENDRMLAWSNHLMDSGIILADAVMNARKNGYVLPAQLHNAAVNPLDLFFEEKNRRDALKDAE